MYNSLPPAISARFVQVFMRKYSNTKINSAGETLKDEFPSSVVQITEAENILTYWRYIHLPILNTFQATLRTKISNKYKKRGFIAQRLKRASSIILKLQREPNMKLSTMQDIAGIRAVMRSIEDVFSLQKDLKKGKYKHILKSEYNYIETPKQNTGYRSLHLIFQYVNLKHPESNGLKIEVQIRTRLQHIWATTVETIDIFLGTHLKASQGPDNIREFFKLTSTAFALIEKTPKHVDHETIPSLEIFKTVVSQYENLGIEDKLTGFTVAVDKIKTDSEINKYHYYIITLEIDTKHATIRYYNRSQLKQANMDYTIIERQISSENKNWQAVLVSTDKISGLIKAYPNYFLDTKDFIKTITKMKDVLAK